MTALIIIAAVLLFLGLLLSFPLRLELRYQESLFIKIRYLFFSAQMVPPKKKKKKKKHKKGKASGKKQKKTEKKSPFSDIIKERGLKGFLRFLREVGKIAVKLLKRLLRHVVVHKLSVSVLAAGADAADTALNYGKVCGVVYPVVGFLVGNTHCKQYHVSVSPGFHEKESAVDFEARLSIRIIFLLTSAPAALWHLIKLLTQQNEQPQKEEKN